MSVELVPGVHRIEAEVGGRPLYLFAFLGQRRLLLDAGCASTIDQFIVPFLEAQGLGLGDLDVLVVTHSDLDHQGGAHLLKRANPSLWVTCGVLDIPLISDPEALIARRYRAYDELHGIAPDDEALAPRELHGCHWPAARGDEVAAFIAETRGYVAHVDGLVRGCLAEPLTLDALIACVNRQLDEPWPDEIAPELVYSVHGHAERLVALGAATSSPGEDGRLVYQEAR
jgi:glyoxylase-like metal-dependent hydrolase (beta-lactamase superfamily II)